MEVERRTEMIAQIFIWLDLLYDTALPTAIIPLVFVFPDLIYLLIGIGAAFTIPNWIFKAIAWHGIDKKSLALTTTWVVYEMLSIVVTLVAGSLAFLFILLAIVFGAHRCEQDSHHSYLCTSRFAFHFSLGAGAYLFVAWLLKVALVFVGTSLYLPSTKSEACRVADTQPTPFALISSPRLWISYHKLSWPAQLSYLILLKLLLVIVWVCYWVYAVPHSRPFPSAYGISDYLIYLCLGHLVPSCIGLLGITSRHSFPLLLIALYCVMPWYFGSLLSLPITLCNAMFELSCMAIHYLALYKALRLYHLHKVELSPDKESLLLLADDMHI